MKASTKRLLSVLLCLAMVLAVLPMAVLAEDATTPSTLYVKPNSNWNNDSPRFAAYFFGNGETWVDCTDADGDGVYEVEVPAGYPNVIFCRMNPNDAANNWDNKWNQTDDLTIPTDDTNCYVVADNTWDKGGGQWVVYTPDGGVGETESTTESPIEFSVAGDAGLCGSEWTSGDVNNMMLDEDGDGIYTITYTNIAAGTYNFKVTDGTWSNSWGGSGTNGNYVLDLTVSADVTINFNSADNTISVDVNYLEEVPETESTEAPAATYYVAGSFNGWQPAEEAYLMTANEDGTYSLALTLEIGEYSLKVTKGSWSDSWGGSGAGGNYEINVVADGEVVISFDPASGTVSASGAGLGEVVKEPLVIESVYVVGSAGLVGIGWTPDAETGLMTLVDGIYTITYTDIAAGTYEFKYAANGTWAINWAPGIEVVSGENQTAWFNAQGNSTLTIPEGTTATVTLTLDLTNMDPVTGANAVSCVTVVTEAIAVDPSASLVLGDNALTLVAGDQDGETWSFTATETDALTLNVTALSYDWMGEGEYTEAPADEIPMGFPRMYTIVINGEAYYASTVTVNVTAGDVLSINIFSNMGYATNLTLNLSMGEAVEPDPSEPGTSDNPIVIETLPYEITVEGAHDLYYTYTATEDVTLYISYLDGSVVSGVGTDKVNGSYVVSVAAGETITINPWATSDGSWTYTVSVGEAPVVENVSVYFDGSLYSWANVNAYAWDADGKIYTAEWPGSAMTQNEDGFWTIEMPEGADYVIFNDGTNQTWDLDFVAGNVYNGWASAVYGTILNTNFYVAGFGNWDAAYAVMNNNGDGTFSVTLDKVPAGLQEYKITMGDWTLTSWGDWGTTSGNYELTLDTVSNVTITFNLNTQIASATAEAYEVTAPTLKPRYPALSFEDVIVMNVFFAAENLDDVVEMGLVTYGQAVADASVDTAEYVIPGYTWSDSDGFYYAQTQGLAPHYLANTYWFAVYAKTIDGNYTYTKVVSYSPVTYANSIINGVYSTEMKTLAAAMLNYGAAAQTYFGVEGELMNSGLTAEQAAMVAPYDASMILDPGTADAAKIGVFANNKGFSKRYPNITLEGAFSINYFFTPAYTPVGDVTLYYWNEADYAAADVLTPENASSALVMTGDGQLTAAVTGIAAKDLDSTIYVAALYTDADGNTWASGVLPYSIGAYCKAQASSATGAMQALAQATAVYAYYAKQLFA